MERVGECMRRHFVAVASTNSFREVETLMRSARLRHVAVVDGPMLTGVVSYRDLLVDWLARLEHELPAARARRLAERTIGPLVVQPPEAVDPRATLAEAASRMSALGLGCLPVVEADGTGLRVIGILAESDLLAAAFGARSGPR